MQRDVHLALGRAGTGKTSLLKHLLVSSDRALVFDPLHNFNFGIVIESRLDLVAYLRRVVSDRFRVIYRPEIEITDKSWVIEEAEILLRASRAATHCDVYLDEVDTFASATQCPAELTAIIAYGRNIGVSIHCAVRRPKAVIPRHLVTETTIMSVFRTIDPEDIGFIGDFARLSREQIESLPDLSFWQWIDPRDCPGGARKFRLQFTDNGSRLLAEP